MIRFYPCKLNGTLSAPASKEHAERLMFMAALSDAPTLIKNVPDCEDIDTAIGCLKVLGCQVTRTEDGMLVEPFPKNVPVQRADFDFGGSATCCKTAIALSGALGILAKCSGNAALTKRRVLSLTSRMALRGVKFSNFSLPCEQEGRLKGGEYIIDGEDGSQTVNSLLMALPLLRDESSISFSVPLKDDTYSEITVSSLEKFGIKIEKTEDGGYHIKGRQYYISPEEIEAENDWSLSSMWITAAAACGTEDCTVTVENLPVNSPQKFRNVSSIINLLHYDFQSLNIDASNCPELATLFAAMAIIKGANVEIEGVPQLRYKECDRLKTMAEIARKLGRTAEVFEEEGKLTISGSGKPDLSDKTVIDCKEDPWVFMSMALACTVSDEPITLSDEHGADKIYRSFLNDFEALGGKYGIIVELKGEPRTDL